MTRLSRNNVTHAALVLAVALIAIIQPTVGQDALGLSGLLGGVGGSVGQLSSNLMGPAGVGGILNSATGLVGGMTRPVMGMLGSITGGQAGPLGMLNTLTGGPTGPLGIAQNPVNGVSMTSGLLGGLASGAQAAANIGTSNQAEAAAVGIAAANIAEQQHSGMSTYPGQRTFKREAIPSGSFMEHQMHQQMAAHEAANVASNVEMGAAAGAMAAGAAGAATAAGAAAAASDAMAGPGMYANQDLATGLGAASLGAQAAAAHEVATGGAATQAALMGAHGAFNPMANMAAASLAGHVAGNVAAATAANHVANVAAANVANAASAESALVGVNQVANHVVSRQALAADALGNAQAEAAIAGADMAAHGANNARSASLAGNAYRQAKLASARDRVNIAGTIQNSARISDAAIATHDAATKAEDSLLGSELAVDSAATVLDSDAAYIPPVTNSLLRSLPYGRLGVRNIVPKPLTYPSVLLPDVWLNGAPVNYMNVPLRALPYGIGSTLGTNQLWQSGAALANGGLINGQPFIANNGRYLNGMVIDPAYSYLAAGHVYGAAGSSIVPILANGQVEAHDEVALANMINAHQLNGAGMSATYQGYGRMNTVPMITGSVNDVNLMPTTTIGTTYPIGSALVIEPRDSYFQDYVDNASSRQNFDERQQ